MVARNTQADMNQKDDPLAALARLISESGPGRDSGRGAGRAQATAPVRTAPTPPTQYAEAEYIDTHEPDASEPYQEADEGVIESYDAPQLAEHYPSHPRGLAAAYEQASSEGQLSESPPPYAFPDDDPVDELDLHGSADLHAGVPESDDAEAGHGVHGDWEQSEPHDFGEDESEDRRRRRGGSVLIAAVLGLAVLGTAGAFAYRAMFGTSALPTLPPIIKASDEPNKIVPNSSATQASSQAGVASADSGGGDRLVSREEQPVDVPKPVNPPPRVVSTIPVFPDPGAGLSGAPPASGLPAGIATPSALPTNPPAFASAGADSGTPQGQPSPPAAAIPLPTPSPKKIHTVVVHSDQPGTGLSAGAPVPSQAPSTAAAVQHAAPAPARPSVAPPHVASGNAPLEIAPQTGDQANPARMHTALAHPPASAPASEAAGAEPASAPETGGGYAVQVSSQRSEAEAQAAYRALRAKYPDQLGGHEPIVRRADLGAKGIYYRALVGPFASAEQAHALCASLKAAGGSCIVQKD